MKLALDQESLLELDYDAEINVLMVKWINKFKVPWHEILNSYKQLVNCINQYQVPYLLIDSLNNSCNEHGEDLKLLAIQLNLDLAFTNLKKVAAIVTKHQQRKPDTYAYEREELIKLPFIFESKTFNDKANALKWLNSQGAYS